MFTRLLQEARSEPHKVAYVTHSPQRQSARNAADHKAADDKVRMIVHEVSEFLFDLFDANCLPAFKAIEALEHQYCRHFSVWEEGAELSHVMHDAWSRFTTLFEKLMEDFLREHGWTNDDCYKAAKKALEDESLLLPHEASIDTWQQNPKEQATEILEVLMAVQDINVWAAQMRELHDRILRQELESVKNMTSEQSKIEATRIQKK